MEVKNDVLSDYIDYCYEQLNREFINCNIQKSDAIYLYQRFKCRIIPQRVRVINEAHGFQVPEHFQEAYERIKADIVAGINLRKYQSRKLKKLDYDDDMLSHWGIQHFHLSTNVESDGFVSRTGDLLFIHLTNSTAHILGIFSHRSWCNLDLIEVLHRNWPEYMSQFKMTGDMRPLTETNYKTLRKKNANANIVVEDGTEYIAPGMGVSSSGAPIQATFNSSKLKFMFNGYFEAIIDNLEQILSCSPESRELSEITIGLELNGELRDFVFVVKETGFRFTIPS
ncbi:hypothetical protein LWM38_15705 [Vibrio kanaloae]|uniref:hypothetical protein n=1 Tax=Vibrio kanaloae TaxID=170673 RepID=UPI000988B7F8|nr:hypothetical protein [Vibrio kanaloae]QPK04000.1 hypothetical protein BTD91_12200 [Vibrio kanaloae]UIJ43088.1 hypothetical protein LWM38_15705 [Vibrio kanaloae]